MAGKGGLIVSELAGTNSGSDIGLHVFVTHDYLVGATARYCLGENCLMKPGPGFSSAWFFGRKAMASASGIRDGKDIFPG